MGLGNVNQSFTSFIISGEVIAIPASILASTRRH
jgi:hypothetical protein